MCNLRNVSSNQRGNGAKGWKHIREKYKFGLSVKYQLNSVIQVLESFQSIPSDWSTVSLYIVNSIFTIS